MTNTKVNSLQFKLIIEDQATNDFRENVVIDKVNNMLFVYAFTRVLEASHKVSVMH